MALRLNSLCLRLREAGRYLILCPVNIAILGRQPKLSLAELEARFGAEKITPIGNYAALVESEDTLPQSTLGGTMKSARLLTRLENTDLSDAFEYLAQTIPEHLNDLPEGKLQFGISIYGAKAQRNWLLKQMLTLKKIIKKSGRSVRIIENKSEALETAQVLYNKLTGPLGWELLLIADGADILLAQTTAVQDIDSYTARDFERPKRDAYVGMLPPKLAQIMINLATPVSASTNTVLDPFCGTGVVLQEALLMGYDAYGSDISKRMIEYSAANLDWLETTFETHGKKYTLEQGDATTHQWKIPSDHTVAVVCETYLGTPLTSLPDRSQLNKIMDEANEIAQGFLKNIATQLPKGTRLCIGLPAWHLGNSKFNHLKVLDQIQNLGYNRLEFAHAQQSELIYHRPDQVVARELIILEKK